MNSISISELQSAAQDGLREVERMIELEKRLFSDGLISNKNKCPGRRNVLQKKRSSNQSRQKTIGALGVVEASKKLRERLTSFHNFYFVEIYSNLGCVMSIRQDKLK